MNLDFDDKVALASQVINKLLNANNKPFNDSAGKIVEDVLNDGGYDTETITSDLEDITDSSIMDGIRDNITQKLRRQWDEQTQQLFYKTLNDIFTNSITDYNKLISGLSELTEDHDAKELQHEPTAQETPKRRLEKHAPRTFRQLDNNELANVVEYIITNMNKNNEFDMNNKKTNLYYHKDNIINYILSQNWNGTFDFKSKIFRKDIHEALQKTVTTVALDKLRKRIMSFDMNEFNNIQIKPFQFQPVIIRNEVRENKQVFIEKAERKRIESDGSKEKIRQDKLLDKMSNGRFIEIVQQAIQLRNKEISQSLTKIKEKEVMRFLNGPKGINKDVFKSLNPKTFSDKLCGYVKKGSGKRLFKQIRDLLKDRILTDLYDDEFYFIVKQGIYDINEDNQKKGTGFAPIECDKVINYFKQIGLNGSKFIASFTKKSLQSQIEDKLSKGATNKLFKYLKNCDIEKVLGLMGETVISNDEAIHEPEMKGNNNQISKPDVISQRQRESKEISIDIDMSYSCDSVSELSDCVMMQLRYALQHVLIEFNKDKEDSSKKISNPDDVIAFLCYKQELDGAAISKIVTADFAYMLYDALKVRHNPGKKILKGLKDYNFDDMPRKNLDLNLPFVLKQSIREQQAKMDAKSKLNENEILWAMQYMKYSQVEDRKQFVEFLKNECHVARGPSIKLRNCIRVNVENICKKNKLNVSIPVIEMKKKDDVIFNVVNKCKHISECKVDEFRQVFECCIECINRERMMISDSSLFLKVLNDKINQAKEKRIGCLQECDNKLFVKVVGECIDGFIENGKFKIDDNNSLGLQTNKMKLLKYLTSCDINGGNFNDKFPKRSRFAKNLSEACFDKKQKGKQKGIKTDLIHVYKEIMAYDYTKLTVKLIVKSDDDSKQMEMNGKIFMNNFKSKQVFIEYMNGNREVLSNLYGFVMDGFFKWNISRDTNYFMNWLYIFAVKRYKIEIKYNNNNNYCQADEELKKLNGNTFVNDARFTCDKFVNILCKSKIFDNLNDNKMAINLYDDLMRFNLRLKGIKQIGECNHNELKYILRKYVLPKFNEKKKQIQQLNIKKIIQSLNRNTDLKGDDFKIENRRVLADKLSKYNKDLKIGPLRKLSHSIDNNIFKNI